MSNSIAAALAYLNNKLDKEYKAASKTSALDINPQWVRAAEVAGTFYLPELSMVGLGNVVGGVFPEGDVTQTWGAYTYLYDRGRKLQSETVAKDEAGAVASLANISAEFLRMHVIPELDSIRLARIATGAHAYHKIQADLTTSAQAIAATNKALVTLSNAEADMDNLILFASPDVLDLIDGAASTEKKARVLNRATIVEVPAIRLNTEVTVDAGSTSSAGGFTLTGDDVNFILMDKASAFADAKHVIERYFPATGQNANQAADADRVDYRIVHDCWVYENKTKGIYVHRAVSNLVS